MRKQGRSSVKHAIRRHGLTGVLTSQRLAYTCGPRPLSSLIDEQWANHTSQRWCNGSLDFWSAFAGFEQGVKMQNFGLWGRRTCESIIFHGMARLSWPGKASAKTSSSCLMRP